MKRLFIKIRKFLATGAERGVAMLSLIYPLLDVNLYFGAKVFMATEDLELKAFWVYKIAPLVKFYETNIYWFFAVMIIAFLGCIKNTFNTSRYIRFNVIQGILLEVFITCFSQIFLVTPVFLRESLVGLCIGQAVYFVTHLTVLYCVLHIIYGKYPVMPVITEGARLNIQWFR